MTDIVVVDYGMGNLRSVAKALVHVAPERAIVVSADPAVIRAAGGWCCRARARCPTACAALTRAACARSSTKRPRTRPFLGICLGLQMLFDRSEEGPTPGLGVLAGEVVRFDRDRDVVVTGNKLKVPHMGWSPVRQTRAHPLWAGIPDGSRFYFAHSYHPVPADPALTAGTTEYPAPFTCAIARANIFATQFHPEKSHRAGLQLLANFVAWEPQS